VSRASIVALNDLRAGLAVESQASGSRCTDADEFSSSNCHFHPPLKDNCLLGADRFYRLLLTAAYLGTDRVA